MRPLARRLRKDARLFGRLEEAAALYAAGKSTTQIAEIFHSYPGNVYRVLKSRGVQLRTRSEAIKNAMKSGRHPITRGAANHAWRGGRTRHSAGYVLIRNPEHPRADARGYVYQHVLVAESRLGRSLRSGEEVHHVNGCKDDNRPSNLRVMTRTEHRRLHAQMQNGRIGINHILKQEQEVTS